jgi:hypothetical protein
VDRRIHTKGGNLVQQESQRGDSGNDRVHGDTDSSGCSERYLRPTEVFERRANRHQQNRDQCELRDLLKFSTPGIIMAPIPEQDPAGCELFVSGFEIEVTIQNVTMMMCEVYEPITH